MTKTFVAINDPVHDQLRNVTRRTPLRASLSPEGHLQIEYQVNPGLLPGAYYGLAWFHALKGLPASTALTRRPGPAATTDLLRVLERVGFFDVVKLDRRCARDLRIKASPRPRGLIAGDVLAFGIGTLRPRNDNPEDHLHRVLWSLYGRVVPKDEVIFATIRSLASNTPAGILDCWKENLDSTNVIYGDALGEIQQLWDRRSELSFLDQVARSLHSLHEARIAAAFLNPPQNLPAAIQLHIRCQARWKKPPQHGRALLKRVEWILDNTVVDHAPEIHYRWREPNPQPNPGPAAPWQRNRYDGSLPGETTA